MYLHKHTISISASSGAGTQTFSTVLSGNLAMFRFTNSTSVPLSTKRVITVGRESSGDELFKFAVPSSNKNFYPRTVCHGTSAAVLKSTDFRCKMPLCRERLSVNVTAASSIGSISGVLTAYIEGN